jgi:hypothetical protein
MTTASTARPHPFGRIEDRIAERLEELREDKLQIGRTLSELQSSTRAQVKALMEAYTFAVKVGEEITKGLTAEERVLEDLLHRPSERFGAEESIGAAPNGESLKERLRSNFPSQNRTVYVVDEQYGAPLTMPIPRESSAPAAAEAAEPPVRSPRTLPEYVERTENGRAPHERRAGSFAIEKNPRAKKFLPAMLEVLKDTSPSKPKSIVQIALELHARGIYLTGLDDMNTLYSRLASYEYARSPYFPEKGKITDPASTRYLDIYRDPASGKAVRNYYFLRESARPILEASGLPPADPSATWGDPDVSSFFPWTEQGKAESRATKLKPSARQRRAGRDEAVAGGAEPSTQGNPGPAAEPGTGDAAQGMASASSRSWQEELVAVADELLAEVMAEDHLPVTAEDYRRPVGKEGAALSHSTLQDADPAPVAVPAVPAPPVISADLGREHSQIGFGRGRMVARGRALARGSEETSQPSFALTSQAA